MNNRDSLGDRMKGYEAVPRSRLIPKMPVMMRLDGKAFHTLTRGLEKPIDMRFVRCMWETAKALCKEIQGCRFAYTFSDEITLLLVDYDTIQTQGWFDYEIQKMCSVAPSTATLAFAKKYTMEFPSRNFPVAMFDARVWNMPTQEVTNNFIWRQNDCTRSSISGLAQAHFSHKELHGKDGRVMQDMLHAKGINWNDCPTVQKRGACIVREIYEKDVDPQFGPPGHGVLEGKTQRYRWIVDEEIPIFTQDREYIEKFVRPREAVNTEI